MALRLGLLILTALTLMSCEPVALLTASKKKPIPSHSPLADKAENQFWETLHAGNYANIPATEKLLLAAYLENPNDPRLASHLGFIHIWKITERARLKAHDPDIVNEIILARKYFEDAVVLNPDDARVQGFLGDSLLVEGKIFHNEREQIRGYFMLKRAISAWPEFNYFTAGYPMSTEPYDSKRFKEALEWQWETLNICAGTKVDRENPSFKPYLDRETQVGSQRACWNSWIAPHNFEGFFLNMGDMLVKAGDIDTAIKIYNNAKLSKTYAEWPYRTLLENRIAHARENIQHFRKAWMPASAGMTKGAEFIPAKAGAGVANDQAAFKTLLFNSGYGCAACHQSKTSAMISPSKI